MDGKDFTVGCFGLWVVAVVEYVEQVVEGAEGCGEFVQRGCPLCACGGCTRTRGKT